MHTRPTYAVLLVVCLVLPLGCSEASQRRAGWPFAQLGPRKAADVDDPADHHKHVHRQRHLADHADDSNEARQTDTRGASSEIAAADSADFEPVSSQRIAQAGHRHPEQPASHRHSSAAHHRPSESALSGTVFASEGTAPIVEASHDTEPAKQVSSAAAPATGTREFARDDNYGWLQGRLEYRYRSRDWRIRYAPHWREDRYGGSLVLESAGSDQQWKDGAWVRISGSVRDSADGRGGIGAVYTVDHTEFFEPETISGS